MIHQLSKVLKNCKNKKYRKDFINYLSTLEFDEFEILYNKYFYIIIRFLAIYGNYNNARIFSENWWKNQKIKNTYNLFLSIFNDGNSKFVICIQNKLIYKSQRAVDITIELTKSQHELENILKIKLNISNNKDDIIRASIYIIKTIILKNKLQKLSEELKSLW